MTTNTSGTLPKHVLRGMSGAEIRSFISACSHPDDANIPSAIPRNALDISELFTSIDHNECPIPDGTFQIFLLYLHGWNYSTADMAGSFRFSYINIMSEGPVMQLTVFPKYGVEFTMFISVEQYTILSNYMSTCNNALINPSIITDRDIYISRSIGELSKVCEIPELKSIEVSEVTARFQSALWYDAIRNKKVILAGLGGIGSYVAFLLARLHIRELIVYDGDTVEAVNMSGQLYGRIHIGQTKAESTYNLATTFSDFYEIDTFNRNFTAHDNPSDIMICGFDSMAARKMYFSVWKDHVQNSPNKKECLYIDGRLAAENFQIFCITGDNQKAIEDYENNQLFDDENADATVCSYKQTSYMANMIGSVMVNCFVNFVSNEVMGVYGRDLPYRIEYDGSLMTFKKE